MTLTNKRMTVILLLALQFTASVTMSMVFSLAPTITTTFNIPASNASFLNIGFVGAGLLSPIFGYYADKKGTKSVLIIGTLIFASGHALAAVSTGVEMYFLARLLVGLGFASILGLIVSYLSKLLDHSRMGHTSAYLKLAFALGVFTSPIMAGALVTRFGFRFLYESLTVVSLILFAGLFWIPQVGMSHTDHLTLKEVWALFKNKKVRNFMGVSLATGLPGYLFFNFLSIYLSEAGYTQNTISMIYSMIGLGSIASAFVIFFLNKRWGLIRIFKAGLVVTIIGLLPMLTLNPLIVIILAPFFSLGYDAITGLINPVLALEYPRQSGTVIMTISLLGAIYGLVINGLGPLLYTAFGFGGMILIAITGTLCGTLSLQRALKRV
jgi:DHA1 family multidrug resistance protein-like MFS transporter